jgi:hypothetical protein
MSGIPKTLKLINQLVNSIPSWALLIIAIVTNYFLIPNKTEVLESSAVYLAAYVLGVWLRYRKRTKKT